MRSLSIFEQNMVVMGTRSVIIAGMKSALIHELLFESARVNGDRPAYWSRSSEGLTSLKYSELGRRVSSIAAGLVQLGFQPGTRVGIYSHSSPEWGIVYMAILAAGGVVVPLDPQLKLLELRTIIHKAEMGYLFCVDSTYQDLVQLKAITAPYPEIISIDAAGDAPEAEELTLAQIEQLGSDRTYVPPAVDPDSMAVLIFTSGTSSTPKGVMLSHANIIADIEAIKPRFRIGTDDRFLSVLPLHHTLEATCGFLFPLLTGASILYAQSFKSSEILADIKSVRATVMCGVPLLYEKMYSGLQRSLAKKRLATRLYVDFGQKLAGLSKWFFDVSVGRLIFRSLRDRAGLDSIRILVSGGAAINPKISQFFNNLGITLIQGYGLSETSPVLSVNSSEDNNYASVGKPLDGIEIRILDPNDAGIGEIAARGRMVMLGYFKNEEATRAVMKDGFFRTGDLGYLDRDGHLHITGRMKNVIITSAGKNIYPEEIEVVLDSLPFIQESVVVPRKRGSGEEPVAVVVPDYEAITAARDGQKLSDEEIRKLLRSEVDRVCLQLADFKRIKEVIVMTEELPKTSTRKVKRYSLIEALQKLGEL
jgi:long-chain acyl-CoA synthetase